MANQFQMDTFRLSRGRLHDISFVQPFEIADCLLQVNANSEGHCGGCEENTVAWFADGNVLHISAEITSEYATVIYCCLSK